MWKYLMKFNWKKIFCVDPRTHPIDPTSFISRTVTSKYFTYIRPYLTHEFTA
jgi:hypothetical protein